MNVVLAHSHFARYHGDLNATYFVGNVDDASKHLVKTTRECLDLAIAMCMYQKLPQHPGPSSSPSATSSGMSLALIFLAS